MSAVAEQTLSTQMPDPLVFTDAAANKVAELIAEEGNPELKLKEKNKYKREESIKTSRQKR